MLLVSVDLHVRRHCNEPSEFCQSTLASYKSATKHTNNISNPACDSRRNGKPIDRSESQSPNNTMVKHGSQEKFVMLRAVGFSTYIANYLYGDETFTMNESQRRERDIEPLRATALI